MPNTSRSMLILSASATPSRRSRTQPPTTSARPPASRTARAMAVACSSAALIVVEPERSSRRLAPEALDDPVGESGREGVGDPRRAGAGVRIDPGARPVERPRAGVSAGAGTLCRTAGTSHPAAGLGRHHIEEFGFGRDWIQHADVDVRANELGAKAFG